MTKLIAIASLLTSCAFAASHEFVPTDNSKETQLCVAATDSESELKQKAQELDFDRDDLELVACNKKPLKKFVKDTQKIRSAQ